MSTQGGTLFEAFLNQYDEQAWAEVIRTLLPHIHEVDKNATQIWFHFFPLSLARALEQAEDPTLLAIQLVLQGNYYLKNQIDSSHVFLYGHRYWPAVKSAIIKQATSDRPPASLELADHIRDVAGAVAQRHNGDPSLLVGITAVGFMTLQQVGLEAFSEYPGGVQLDPDIARRTPEQVLAARATKDRQPLLGWLRYPDKVWTVTFNENAPSAKFRLINSQHLTTAAANDKRPHHLRDPRCVPHEGPIPVQCRSAACGTCWVGILAGAENLSPVGPLERRQIKEFGYISTTEPRPLIRLACQAQAFGPVSIVIPPWNGILGRSLRWMKKKSASADQVSGAGI